MKCYFLLRNNKESGPLSLKELGAMELSATDLIWMEGESRTWAFAADLPELKIAIGLESFTENGGGAKPNDSVKPIANEKSLAYTPPSAQIAAGDRVAEDHQSRGSTIGTKSTLPHAFKRKRRNNPPFVSNFFGFTVLLISAMLCTFIVKKMIDSFGYEPTVASAQAQEIKTEMVVVSNSDNAAKSPMMEPLQPLFETMAVANDSFAWKPITKPSPVIAKKTMATSVKSKLNPGKKDLNNQVEDTAATTANKEATSVNHKEVAAEVKPPLTTASLQIASNNYKVGLFGGISELELTITNSSQQTIGVAMIEVEFLKPNGNTLKKQVLPVENIGAGAQKILAVPANSRA